MGSQRVGNDWTTFTFTFQASHPNGFSRMLYWGFYEKYWRREALHFTELLKYRDMRLGHGERACLRMKETQENSALRIKQSPTTYIVRAHGLSPHLMLCYWYTNQKIVCKSVWVEFPLVVPKETWIIQLQFCESYLFLAKNLQLDSQTF